MNTEDLYDKINNKMKAMGYSHNRLCLEAELSHGYFTLWKKNPSKMPTLDALNKICEALNTSLTSVLLSKNTVEQGTMDDRDFFERYLLLTERQKKAINGVVNEYLKK